MVIASGTKVVRVDKQASDGIISKTTAPEVWCLKMDRFVDDGSVRVGGTHCRSSRQPRKKSSSRAKAINPRTGILYRRNRHRLPRP